MDNAANGTRTASMHLRSIDVRTAPGIPHGFRIEGFVPGINIITGPNASGKSTTSRLLRQLFWTREADTEADYRVSFRYSGADWSVRRAGSYIGCDRDGSATALPVFHDYGDELRERYHLPLHDLLGAEDSNFAALIAREAAGGYDLEEAIKKLGFAASPPQPQNLARIQDDAKLQLKLANDAQRALMTEEEELVELRKQAQESLDATAYIQVLDRIAAAVAARSDRSAASVTFEGFRKDIERLRGDEGEQLRQLNEQEAQLHLDRARVLQSREEAERDLAASRLTPNDQLRVDIGTLDGYRETLAAIDRDLEDLTLKRSETKQRAEQARADAAANLSDDRIVPQGLELLTNLAQAMDRRNQALSEFAARDAIASWLGDIEQVEDLDRLRDGIRLLRDWLRAPAPSAQKSAQHNAYLLLFASVVIAGSAVALGVWTHPAGYALLVVAIGLFVYGFIASRELSAGNPQADAEAKFLRLHVGSLEVWDSESVEALLADLETDLQHGLLEQQKSQRWGDLEQKRKAAQQLAFELTARSEELRVALGTTFELDQHSIGVVAGRVNAWISANDALIAVDGTIAAQQARRAELIERFNQLSSMYELPVASDAATIVSVLAALKDRERIADAAVRRIEQSESQLRDAIEPQFSRISAQRDEIRARTQLDDLEEISALCEERPAWEQARQALSVADGAFAIQRSHLPPDLELDDWDEPRIAAERTEATLLAGRYEEVVEKIKAIEARVNQAKSGNTVDRALIALDRATVNLETHRQESIAKGIGDWIASRVREESDESNLPQVVRVAQRLFSQITLGRFDLRFKPGVTPGFTAVETSSGEALALKQLSSATRVQLLLSVRMAFIETGERTAKLPVMLDETLANADELRAIALIEAVFELSRQGRQIFYFTAQAEEVAKWQAMAANYADVPFVVTDLAMVRGLAALGDRESLRLAPLLRTSFPAPNGCSREEYRVALSVPPLDRWATSAGEAHLWYLEPDPATLHDRLERDIVNWGQLRSAYERGGAAWLRVTDDDYRKLAARAGVLSSVMEYARIGHGRPMSRMELAESPIGSSSLVQQVGALLECCEGNARTLCVRLKSREVAGLRTKLIEDLEVHCRELGHIVDETPLSADEIRMRVAIDHRVSVEQGLIDDADIDRLFADLALPVTSEPLAMQAVGE